MAVTDEQREQIIALAREGKGRNQKVRPASFASARPPKAENLPPSP